MTSIASSAQPQSGASASPREQRERTGIRAVWFDRGASRTRGIKSRTGLPEIIQCMGWADGLKPFKVDRIGG